MCRVGKQPLALPPVVEFRIAGPAVPVTGRRGELPRRRTMHGLTRTLIANMVTGVSEGFSKTLEMQGVGYRAQMQGQALVLAVGFSHPVQIAPPANIEFEVEGTSKIVVKGINKEQ